MKRTYFYLLLAGLIPAIAVSVALGFLFAHAGIFNNSAAAAALSILKNIILAFLLFGIFIAAAGLFLIKPLKEFGKAVMTSESGDADLSRRLDFHGANRLKELLDAFNLYTDKLSGTIDRIKGMVDRSTEIGENVETATKKTAALSREVSHSIERNKDMMASLNGEIACSLEGMKTVRSLITALSEKILHEQAASIDQSTAAVEEMVASIRSITNVTGDKKVLTDNVRELTRKGSRDMTKTIDSISEVSKSASAINDMIKDINDVAERINLLAMNAAIEAAHAGEAGKGFAVVASEVKKLAENTNTNVRDISESLSVMVKRMDEATEVSRQMVESIRNIETAAESVASGMEEINGGVSEVSLGGGEILKALELLKDITKMVKGASEESDTKMEDVTRSIGVIADLSADNLDNARQMEGLVTEISQSVDGLLEQGKHNAEQIAGLDAVVSRLKTGKRKDSFVLGFNDVPPFSMTDADGGAVGASNELFLAIANEIGIRNIEFRHIQSLERIYEMLDRGSIDAYTLATATYPPNPSLKYAVPAKPSITPAPGFLVQASLGIDRISSAADLKKIRIASKNGMPLTPTLESSGVGIDYLGGEEPLKDCIRMMMKGHLDAVYSIIVTELKYMAKELGFQDKVKTLALPDPPLSIYTAFSPKAAERWIALYNKGFEAATAKKGIDEYLYPYLS